MYSIADGIWSGERSAACHATRHPVTFWVNKDNKAYIWNDVPYSRVNDNYSYLFIENDQFDIHCFCLNSWKSRLGIAISARGNPRALCFFLMLISSIRNHGHWDLPSSDGWRLKFWSVWNSKKKVDHSWIHWGISSQSFWSVVPMLN